MPDKTSRPSRLYYCIKRIKRTASFESYLIFANRNQMKNADSFPEAGEGLPSGLNTDGE
jgi:hypothetical protein